MFGHDSRHELGQSGSLQPWQMLVQLTAGVSSSLEGGLRDPSPCLSCPSPRAPAALDFSTFSELTEHFPPLSPLCLLFLFLEALLLAPLSLNSMTLGKTFFFQISAIMSKELLLLIAHLIVCNLCFLGE